MLQHTTFPYLQILKIPYSFPINDILIKFLENNRKDLKEFYINSSNYSLLLAIAKFCPNLKSLYCISHFIVIKKSH